MKNKHNYPISATFIDEISWDIPSNNWTKKDWYKDLKAMKSVGIDTIVFIRGGLENSCIYPSQHFSSIYDEKNDFLKYMLEMAEKLKMKVYIGLYMSTINWDNGDYQKMHDDNVIFVNEILKRYGQYKSIVGWYIPCEICQVEFNIIETMELLTSFLKKITPDKKIYWCPLFRTRILEPIENELSYEQTYEVWKLILKSFGKNIDSISFTDGTAPLEMLDGYLDATKKAADLYGIEYWANVELFARVRPNIFEPIQFEKLTKKIDIIKKYAVKMNSFEFSHFMSPNSSYESGKRLFKRYKKHYF